MQQRSLLSAADKQLTGQHMTPTDAVIHAECLYALTCRATAALTVLALAYPKKCLHLPSKATAGSSWSRSAGTDAQNELQSSRPATADKINSNSLLVAGCAGCAVCADCEGCMDAVAAAFAGGIVWFCADGCAAVVRNSECILAHMPAHVRPCCDLL